MRSAHGMHDIQHSSAPSPADQAHGLRRLFAGTQARYIALVSNPHVAFSSVMLERVTAVLDAMGLNTLVVDAADSSPAPHELAALDLRDCIEPLSPQVSYLAARGLPMRHVDTRGSSAHFLDRLQSAAPQARVLLVHAGAGDLARLFARRTLRPVLLAADQPESVTHAYAAMKLLALRCALMSFDLLLAAAPRGVRVPRIAQRLASCADSFLGAALHDWVAIDPACDVRDAPGDALTRLVAAQLRLHADEPADTDLHMPPPVRRTHSRALGAMNLN
jgi:hypothetical protein